ncbi:MAG: TRAP transporter small permease subunit [Sneathiella sp.]|nr:TRAP transporter small permease subunit [Sneathiella sp.]
MPGVNFVLPHWLYWLGLIIFPLIAMYLAKRRKEGDYKDGYTLGTAYFVWIVGGFLGLHRLYLRSAWGFIFWPLFALILYASSVERDARVDYSNATAELELVDSSVLRKEKSIKKSEISIFKTQAKLDALPDDDKRAKRHQRKIDKETKKISTNRDTISKIKGEVPGLTLAAKSAKQMRERWNNFSLYALLVIAGLLLVDIFRIPKLCNKANEALSSAPQEPDLGEEPVNDKSFVGTGFAGIIDRISLFSGEYVAFWSIIAVFVYYYEVVVRYVFNSPTNWAHESMFLMFGMQYLVAGAYAMLTGSHVRVDIFYAKMPPRGKAFVDLLTSVFFFIFAGTLLGTSYIFSVDAIGQNEVSFTEWAVHYWPVKCVMVIGALLLILQGISTVLKDVAVLFGPSSNTGETV